VRTDERRTSKLLQFGHRVNMVMHRHGRSSTIEHQQ
jgi:hypothetical protein